MKESFSVSVFKLIMSLSKFSSMVKAIAAYNKLNQKRKLEASLGKLRKKGGMSLYKYTSEALLKKFMDRGEIMVYLLMGSINAMFILTEVFRWIQITFYGVANTAVWSFTLYHLSFFVVCIALYVWGNSFSTLADDPVAGIVRGLRKQTTSEFGRFVGKAMKFLSPVVDNYFSKRVTTAILFAATTVVKKIYASISIRF